VELAIGETLEGLDLCPTVGKTKDEAALASRVPERETIHSIEPSD
jgi:hypothetical protein